MSIYERCPNYWKGCFSCPEFMRTEIFFCRKANRIRFGVEIVPIEEEKKFKAEKQRTGGCW